MVIQWEINHSIWHKGFQEIYLYRHNYMYKTPWINAQCRSMLIKIVALIRNSSQCRCLSINADQFLSMLINVDRHWNQCRDFDRHWSALIGIDRHWELIEGVPVTTVTGKGNTNWGHIYRPRGDNALVSPSIHLYPTVDSSLTTKLVSPLILPDTTVCISFEAEWQGSWKIIMGQKRWLFSAE